MKYFDILFTSSEISCKLILLEFIGGDVLNRIKDLRIKSGLRQIDLAEKLDVLQSTISHWENGKVEPDNESLKKMSEIFETTVDDIIGATHVNRKAQKKEPATVSGDGQAEKLAKALESIGIDVDKLSEAEISRIARLAKAALEE